MKVYVIKPKKYMFPLFIAMLVAISLILCAQGIQSSKKVFSTKKVLPIYCVDCVDKTMAITFDCAWGSDDIPDILDTLKKENIRATFFIVGEWAKKFPDMTKKIAQDGHDIANHSYSHPKMTNMNDEALKNDIYKCSQILNEITNRKIELFRAPYGAYNDNVINQATNMGYTTIQWSLDSIDWKPGITRDEIKNRVLKKASKGDVVLFHNDTPHTSKILPEIISSLKKEGFSFLPVSELILRENYYIDEKGCQKRNS